MKTRALALVGLASALAAAGLNAYSVRPAAADPSANSFTCTVASITDGDTFRCAETEATGRRLRVRLSGVNARERDGSCRSGHPCPAAPPQAATAALTGLAAGQVLSCRRVGFTHGRIAAFCRRADGRDLSCAMLQTATVARWNRHWGGHRCPS